MVKIKICGITNLKDALRAVELGADALGFNFYLKSPRLVSEEMANDIIRQLPPFFVPVGIFVNETSERIKKVVGITGIQAIQLHGDESPEFCSQFSKTIIKAIRVKNHESLKNMNDYKVNAFLLDSYSPKYGGSGKTINWELAKEAKKYGRIILAGGLNPDNIVKAIKEARPYGVDVCSGVEKEPGKKDHEKLKKLIQAVKNLNIKHS
ncbi:MAG: phosphoribosylanthranilate isomerase [Deltaproteobacteria bacterium]|nr:MAG: phosphoribosylanthranilate isomerase [Deltaproteobacteria bacterium]